MELSGPDGKPLNAPQAPGARMPSRREKYNLVFMMFTLMDREERRGLIKALKLIRPRLDLMYPMGMKEGDIKNDLTKATDAIIPKGQEHAEPENPEVAPVHGVSVQPESDQDHVEVAAQGEEGGC